MTTTRAALPALAACAALGAALPAAAQQVAPPAGSSDLGGPTLIAAPGVLAGRLMRFRGTVAAEDAGRVVEVQRRDPQRGWVLAAAARSGADGAFLARWRPRTLGPASFRLVVRREDGVRAATAEPTVDTTVYRRARATWYGPGFFGKRTACGQRLGRGVMGVAHRTLPCGTPVTVYSGGTSITVPVVDRGPFANGAHYDLTEAAADALGLTQTTTVGVLPHRGRRMAPPLAGAVPGTAEGGTAYMPEG